MKAEVINLLSPSSKPAIRVSHADEALEFRMSSFTMKPFQDGDVFAQINAFWASTSAQEQAYVFSLYRRIYDQLSIEYEALVYLKDLNNTVAELLNFHEYERIRHWVLFVSNVVIPGSFAEEYKPDLNKKTSREQTYTRGEYIGLVCLAIIFRTMIPVWGEFITISRQETGTRFKEHRAFKLCSKSHILHSEPYEKLKLYIDLAIGDDNKNKDNIIDGISSEDFPDWMIATVFVRRLCMGDLAGIGNVPEANLVTSVWKFVTQKIKSPESGNEVPIKDKNNKDYDDSGNDPSDKHSVLERYKIKQNISIGDVTILEYSVSNLAAVAFRLSQNMTPVLLEDCLRTAQALTAQSLRDPQITLLRWVMKPVISPHGILYLSKPSIVNLMGVMQAVLWARGFHFLALLSTCYADVSTEEMRISGMDSRAQLTKEKRNRLDELYPYMKNTGSRRSGQKPVNMAIRSIDALVENLSMYSWKLTASNEWVEAVMGPNPTQRLSISYNIRNEIADLVIQIGSQGWK